MLNYRCPVQLNEGVSFQDLDTAKLLSTGNVVFFLLKFSKWLKIFLKVLESLLTLLSFKFHARF